jgi:hypothetical protein
VETSPADRWGLGDMAIGGPAIVEGALRLSERVGIRQGAVGATIVFIIKDEKGACLMKEQILFFPAP